MDKLFATDIADRKAGALLGLAVGDALGTTLEFSSPKRGLNFYKRLKGPHTGITGGGPFNLRPGQVTDDTHMACCLAASLMEMKRYDMADALLGYMDWAAVAFDIGGQTRASLRLPEEGDSVDSVSERVWIESGCQAAGNGSLMRTAPIGVFFANNEDERRYASINDSSITHYDPRCQMACAVFNDRIARLINGETDSAELLGDYLEIDCISNHYPQAAFVE